MNMAGIAQPEDFKTYTAQRVRVSSGHCVDRRELACLKEAQVQQRIDSIHGHLIYEMVAGIYAMPKQMIRVHLQWPKTWVDAVKLRFAPNWWLAKWPVQFERFDLDKQIYGAVCPHLQADPQKQHLKWMALYDDS